jgi:hypothetical protein
MTKAVLRQRHGPTCGTARERRQAVRSDVLIEVCKRVSLGVKDHSRFLIGGEEYEI